MRRIQPVSEASMQSAEAGIPRRATEAGRAAHRRALDQTGRVVMKSAGGQLVEQQANGTVVVLKSLPASTPAKVGTMLTRTKTQPK